MPDERMWGLYGTSRLHTKGNDDLNRVFRPEGSDTVILGSNAGGFRYTGVTWWPAHQKGHAFTFGVTQSGKGVGMLIPALLSYGNPYGLDAGGGIFCVDPKGENCFTTFERRLALGQKVVILDPWNEVNRRFGRGGQVVTPSRFNPLARLDPTSPDFADDIAVIADAIVVTPASVSDPHWSDSARQLIGGMIAAVVEKAPGVATLDDVRSMLMDTDEELKQFVEMIRATRPDSLAARKLNRFTGTSDEIGSIRSTAETQTAILDSVRLMSSMSSSDDGFDLGELANGATVFAVLPFEKLNTHGRWLRLVLSQAIDAVAKREAPPKNPVLFLIDEMGTIGRLEKLETAVGLLSSYGIRIWGFLQDLGQLQADYPQKWRTFLANASYLQLLGAGDDLTANWFSERLGTGTIVNEEESFGFSQGTNSGRSPGGVSGGSSHSYNSSTSLNYYQRPVKLPSEIYSMPSDELIIIGPQGDYWQVKKFVYFREPEYRGMFRQNPSHRPPSFLPNKAELQASAYEEHARRATSRSKRGKFGMRSLAAFCFAIVLIPAGLYWGFSWYNYEHARVYYLCPGTGDMRFMDTAPRASCTGPFRFG